MSTPPPFIDDLNGVISAQNKVLQNAGLPTTSTGNDYKTIAAGLDNNQTALSAALSQNVQTLNSQGDVKQILDTEYDRLNQKQQNIDLALDGKKRAAILNENYRERFSQYTKILLIIIVSFLIVFFLNYFREIMVFVPGVVFDILNIVVFVIAAILCYTTYMTIITRDKIYFNELNLSPPNIQPTSSGTYSAQNTDTMNLTNFGMCIGSGCCDNKTTWWDSVAGACSITPPPTTGPPTTRPVSAFTTLDLAYSQGEISKIKSTLNPIKPNAPTEFNEYAVYN
jgi:hypothetical protein